MDELHEQTVNLLSFQQLPKTVFDSQVAFNLLDRYGEKSSASLSSMENRIQRHFQSIVQGRLAVPSLMLLQAPIFHGHAFSLYIEMEQTAQAEELTAALSGDHVDVLQGGEESPSNVNAAGQEQIQVFVAPGFAARQRILDLGRLRQFAHCCHHRSGVRGKHDCLPPARHSPVKPTRSTHGLVVGCVAVVLLLAATGCGYHTGGHAVRMPSDLHTLYVPAFANATHTYSLGQTLTEDVVRELRSRTNYRIVTTNDGTADATLTGTRNLFRYCSAHLRLQHRTHLVSHGHDHNECLAGQPQRQGHLWENPNYLYREQYQVSRDVASFFEEEEPAVDSRRQRFRQYHGQRHAGDLLDAQFCGFRSVCCRREGAQAGAGLRLHRRRSLLPQALPRRRSCNIWCPPTFAS